MLGVPDDPCRGQYLVVVVAQDGHNGVLAVGEVPVAQALLHEAAAHQGLLGVVQHFARRVGPLGQVSGHRAHALHVTKPSGHRKRDKRRENKEKKRREEKGRDEKRQVHEPLER